jgi:Holliday junction resolvase RusA-like endonuclease
VSNRIEFVVYGKPAQMGSKKAFVRGGRAIITDDNSEKRKQWANAVSSVAAEVMRGRDLISSPVQLRALFYFRRPNSHYGSGRNATTLKASAPELHSQTPDLDKLIRCLGDALTGIVFRDDALIWSMVISRHWTEKQERAEVEVLCD